MRFMLLQMAAFLSLTLVLMAVVDLLLEPEPAPEKDDPSPR